LVVHSNSRVCTSVRRRRERFRRRRWSSSRRRKWEKREQVSTYSMKWQHRLPVLQYCWRHSYLCPRHQYSCSCRIPEQLITKLVNNTKELFLSYWHPARHMAIGYHLSGTPQVLRHNLSNELLCGCPESTTANQRLSINDCQSTTVLLCCLLTVFIYNFLMAFVRLSLNSSLSLSLSINDCQSMSANQRLPINDWQSTTVNQRLPINECEAYITLL